MLTRGNRKLPTRESSSVSKPSFDVHSKTSYAGNIYSNAGVRISILHVSTKGQIVLPAALRRRLGLAAGARLEVLEEPDGLKLRVVRAVRPRDVSRLAGLIKVPARGVPRRLEDFDPAVLTGRTCALTTKKSPAVRGSLFKRSATIRAVR